MKNRNKRKWGKCQGILRKSSQLVLLGYEEDENSEEEEKETRKEKKKRVEIQEKEEQLMINLNEAKLMNEENWIETTKMRKNLKKLMKKFVE